MRELLGIPEGMVRQIVAVIAYQFMVEPNKGKQEFLPRQLHRLGRTIVALTDPQVLQEDEE